MNIHCHASNAGRLISRGHGRHVSRVIDSWELILVLKSEIKMFVGREKYTVPAGKCLLLPPGIRHGGLTRYTENLSFFWIHFYPDGKKSEEMLQKRSRCFVPDNPSRLSEYFQLYLARQEETPEDRAGLDLIMALILHEAFHPTGERQNGNSEPEPRQVEQAAGILTLRFREPLSTSVIARELQCNPDYLGRLYRKYRQETLTEALIRIRLKHAAALLRDTMLTITQVAYEAGFNDPGYFRQCFFRKYAVSPRVYRNLKRQGHINTE